MEVFYLLYDIFAYDAVHQVLVEEKFIIMSVMTWIPDFWKQVLMSLCSQGA